MWRRLGLMGVMQQAQAQFNQLREVMEMQKYRSFDSKMKVLLRLSIGENVDEN